MKNIEVVQEHEYQDIYRIQYGVLLIINKHIKNKYISSCMYKKKSMKVKEINKCFITKEDIVDLNEVYPAGSIILDGYLITPIRKVKDFSVELKMSGGTFSGSIEEYMKFNAKIESILKKY